MEGFGAFSTARTFASHILTTLVRVCVCVRRGGGVGARQSITPDTHKAHFMGIKEAAVCVHVCVRTCVAMGNMVRLVQACASMRQRECARACVCELLSVLRVLFCACGCVRRQISKNARWEASPYFQAVDGKQPLGSAGLKQLEKFVEGAQRGCTAPRPQLSAGKGKP